MAVLDSKKAWSMSTVKVNSVNSDATSLVLTTAATDTTPTFTPLRAWSTLSWDCLEINSALTTFWTATTNSAVSSAPMALVFTWSMVTPSETWTIPGPRNLASSKSQGDVHTPLIRVFESAQAVQLLALGPLHDTHDGWHNSHRWPIASPVATTFSCDLPP